MPPTDPDQGQDLVRGLRTLTGTVERGGSCPVVRVGRDTWALLGPEAAGLADRATVTVRGTVAIAPAGCGATRALRVTTVHAL